MGHHRFVVIGLLLGATVTGACASEPQCRTFDCDDAAADAATRGDSGGQPDVIEPVDTLDPARLQLTAVEIDPPTTVVNSVDGATAATRFRVIGVRRDGVRMPLLGATWSVDADRVGRIDANGEFTAYGIAGGRVGVRAEVPGPMAKTLHAVATLNVQIERSERAPGIASDIASRIAGYPLATAGDAPQVVYPLDGAVMPNNVAPPEIQFTAGPAGSVYRINVIKHGIVTSAYVSEADDHRNRWTIGRALWRSIAESSPREQALVSVDRIETGPMRIVQGNPIRVRVTHGGVFGAVYYWDVNDGRIQRINADSATVEHFMPSPPLRPLESTERCAACHTVSRDGRYLSASLGSRGPAGSGTHWSAVFDLTRDLSATPAPATMMSGADYITASFSPDSSRLLVNYVGGGLGILDVATGNRINVTGLAASGAGNPEWSPDGNSIAYISNANNSDWAIRFTRGDLTLAARSSPDSFAAPRVIHRGDSLQSQSEGGITDSHPSWSPDSRLIAFQHGHGSESIAGSSALYSVEATEHSAHPAVRLNNAVGGAGANHAYWPTFSPFVTAEPGERLLYWLAFFTDRRYGNHDTGGKQLWVTAIDPFAAPGTDPSSVPYWLPGQDTTTENIAAYWAPVACRRNAADCNASSECCSGSCRTTPGEPSRTTCQPPPPAECRRRGATCSSSGDCCSGLECNVNVCDEPPPG